MWIRDRINASNERIFLYCSTFVLGLRNTAYIIDKKPNRQTTGATLIPVSYTHLDVYKRQVLRASDVASINSIMTVFEQQSNERTQ